MTPLFLYSSVCPSLARSLAVYSPFLPLLARFAFSPFALWPSLAVARSDNRKKREFLQRAARGDSAGRAVAPEIQIAAVAKYSNSGRTAVRTVRSRDPPPVRAVVAACLREFRSRNCAFLSSPPTHPPCLSTVFRRRDRRGCEHGPRRDHALRNRRRAEVETLLSSGSLSRGRRAALLRDAKSRGSDPARRVQRRETRTEVKG